MNSRSAAPKPSSFRDLYGAELDDTIRGLASDPERDAAARQAQRERADADRLQRHTQLVDLIQWAQRGGLGRNKESTVAIDAIARTLAGRPPRECEMAQLVLCESIVKEAKTRIWKAKKAKRKGRESS